MRILNNFLINYVFFFIMTSSLTIAFVTMMTMDRPIEVKKYNFSYNLVFVIGRCIPFAIPLYTS